jgi:hypothetical protein
MVYTFWRRIMNRKGQHLMVYELHPKLLILTMVEKEGNRIKTVGITVILLLVYEEKCHKKYAYKPCPDTYQWTQVVCFANLTDQTN